jgi:hypothetical protein
VAFVGKGFRTVAVPTGEMWSCENCGELMLGQDEESYVTARDRADVAFVRGNMVLCEDCFTDEYPGANV